MGVTYIIDLRRDEDEAPYWTVKNSFADISLNLIAQMCARPSMLEYFLDLASRDSGMFLNLAHIVTYLDAPKIRSPFVAHFGNDWRKRYGVVAKEVPWHSRPMVPDETRAE